LIVGGITESRIAIKQMIASTPPAAAIICPSMDFVELTGIFDA